MGYVMTDDKFIERAKLAASVSTLYIKGCFGAPMNDYNKLRYSKNDVYNKAPARQKLIQAATPDTYGFDCVCTIKGILWDWRARPDMVYGGATYKSNGVPDFPVDATQNSKGLMDYCTEVSQDFTTIVPGEVLHIPGHCGIYIGDGLAVEATSRWKDGVQITAVANLGNNKKVANARTWNEHGKLQWIEYKAKKDLQYSVILDIVRKGSEGASVSLAQKLLNADLADGYEVDVTGYCDKKTVDEIKAFQQKQGLQADGVIGTKTWSALLGIEVTKL